jgi:putative ABC transport system permease protein
VVGLVAALFGADTLGPWIEARLGVSVPGGAGAVRLDPTVIVFSLGVVALLGILVGLRPALAVTRVDPARSLGASERTSGAATRGRFRAGVIVSQVAVSFLLLIGTGLMVRTILALNGTELGFRPEGVLKAHLLLPQARYPDLPSRVVAVDQALERIRGVPGVVNAAVVMPPPFRGGGQGQPFQVEGRVAAAGEAPLAVRHVVAGDYFGTMGIELAAGKSFDVADGAGAEPVAIISATLAAQLWPGQSAVGRRIRLGDDDSVPWRQVVGVVADVRKTFTGDLHGDTYVPYSQAPGGYFAFVVRGADEPAALAAPVQQALLSVAPDLPLHDVETMNAVVERQGSQQRFLAALLGAFAALAVLLALLGLYSVLAYAVSQRAREIAVRVAVGASAGNVASMVVREGAALTAIGIGGGLAGSVILVRWVRSQLYGVTPFDLTTFAAAALLFTLVAAVAVLLPAVRAARLDPASVLKSE